MSENLRQRIALTPERRALLELRLREKRGASVKQKITRTENTNVHPLSFEQERLWFLHLLEPHGLMHNLNRISTLDGSLDVNALQKAFDEVVRRHEILRTTLTLTDEDPIQIVEPVRTGRLLFIDLLQLPVAERATRAEELAAQQAREPFDLAIGPLMRASLLRLSETRHVLLLTLHHVITDWWSFGVLDRELLTLYQAFAKGEPSPLPELSIQYGDYARWQRALLQGKELEMLVSYWKQQLLDSPQLLNLPTDRPRPLKQTFHGRRHRFEFPKELYHSLDTLSHAEGATTFMTTLAIFQVLLYRYTAQEDILVGTPSTHRSRLETEGLIGFLLNTLVLRGDLSGDPTFRELLARLRQTVVDAYAHQDMPFQKLVEELRTDRNRSVMPLVQVCFIFLSTQKPNLDLAIPQLSQPQLSGLSSQLRNVETVASEFDLTLSLENRPGSLDGFFEYSTELFDPSTITRMVEHLRTLMEAVVANPDQRISELPLLTVNERDSLLVSSADSTAVQHVHEQFESQAARTPGAVAISFQDESITYCELNERANKLAHHLMQLGVNAETRVAILLDRSIEMVIGLLGILKAGGVYLPLETSYPSERWALMVEDAGAQFLLTQERLATHFSSQALNVICIDTQQQAIASQNNQNPINRVAGDNLVYVIYTSGSSGRPKGVQVTHAALSNFLNSVRQTPGLTSDDVVLAAATISFDISTLEIFLPLTTGARIVLADGDDVRDGARLLSLIEDHGVTIVQATPGTWHLMLAADWTTGAPLKILSGGEALPRPMADQLLRRCDSLWNLYGPTEATVWTHVTRITADHETHFIGYPITGVQACVLDKNLQPAPIGVVGEIYIGGVGVARGYVNSAALTAERFTPNSLSTQPGARWYRTGDLGRRRSDGSIEFLGRSDYQVKLRGMRVELGEIETVLRTHQDVRECVVMPRGDQMDAILIAYVVPAEDGDLANLRDFLRSRLPRHMVPSVFVELERLPLLPNGKLDRRALPSPNGQSTASPKMLIAPRNEFEQTIAGIWREVLGIEQIGIHDNFFDVGGHSLRMLQVHLKLRELLQRDLPLFELFQYPTVSALANHLQTGGDGESLASSEQRVEHQRSEQQRQRRQIATRRLKLGSPQA